MTMFDDFIHISLSDKEIEQLYYALTTKGDHFIASSPRLRVHISSILDIRKVARGVTDVIGDETQDEEELKKAFSGVIDITRLYDTDKISEDEYTKVNKAFSELTLETADVSYPKFARLAKKLSNDPAAEISRWRGSMRALILGAIDSYNDIIIDRRHEFEFHFIEFMDFCSLIRIREYDQTVVMPSIYELKKLEFSLFRRSLVTLLKWAKDFITILYQGKASGYLMTSDNKSVDAVDYYAHIAKGSGNTWSDIDKGIKAIKAKRKKRKIDTKLLLRDIDGVLSKLDGELYYSDPNYKYTDIFYLSQSFFNLITIPFLNATAITRAEAKFISGELKHLNISNNPIDYVAIRFPIGYRDMGWNYDTANLWPQSNPDYNGAHMVILPVGLHYIMSTLRDKEVQASINRYKNNTYSIHPDSIESAIDENLRKISIKYGTYEEQPSIKKELRSRFSTTSVIYNKLGGPSLYKRFPIQRKIRTSNTLLNGTKGLFSPVMYDIISTIINRPTAVDLQEDTFLFGCLATVDSNISDINRQHTTVDIITNKRLLLFNLSTHPSTTDNRNRYLPRWSEKDKIRHDFIEPNLTTEIQFWVARICSITIITEEIEGEKISEESREIITEQSKNGYIVKSIIKHEVSSGVKTTKTLKVNNELIFRTMVNKAMVKGQLLAEEDLSIIGSMVYFEVHSALPKKIIVPVGRQNAYDIVATLNYYAIRLQNSKLEVLR